MGGDCSLRRDGGKLFQMSGLQTAIARRPKSVRVRRTMAAHCIYISSSRDLKVAHLGVKSRYWQRRVSVAAKWKRNSAVPGEALAIDLQNGLRGFRIVISFGPLSVRNSVNHSCN